MTTIRSTDGDAASLRDLAVDVAREAGEQLLDTALCLAAGGDLPVTTKSSVTDPVSAADRTAERLIARRLAAYRPSDGLVGEEGEAPRTGTSGLTWIVDPLDGTVNFLYGNPSWCVSIACHDDEGGVVGVVHDPSRGETFHATRGGGAWLRTETDGDRRLHCTETERFDELLVSTGFSYEADVRAVQGSHVADLLTRVRDVRRTGSAALDLAWCAAGRTDAMVEFGLKPWDWAAGTLLVGEAGGRVSHLIRTLAGHPLPGIVAAGDPGHDALLTWLATLA